MTRKDYELIASTISKERTAFKTLKVHPSHQVGLLVNSLATALRSTNPNYDINKFLAACEVKL